MSKFKIPRKVSIELELDIESSNGKENYSQCYHKEIEERRKIFSGEDFKF